MPLTDPAQTILGLLKDGSTGLGTTGYEIYQDNGSTDCALLITYPLSKEKLTALFGGDQDYDVIFTIKSGEAITEYIGLGTTMQKTPVVITIHVIEKHTAVGTGQKYITPELVRWKAKEALLAFIKANANAPGGSVGIWKALDDHPEEDTSKQPTIYKYVVNTETWIYR